MTGHIPPPLILDTTVLRELARGDVDMIGLIQAYDAEGQPLVVPTLAIAHVLLGTRTEAAVDAMHGLAMLERVTVAPLRDVEQAASLAAVMASTGLAVWDAQVAAIADVSVCPILTRDAAAWRGPSAALDQPLFVIEVADP